MFRWLRQGALLSLATTAGLAVITAPARAGFTPVAQPKHRGELSHEQILERAYGGDFVADPTGLSFSNGSGVTVTRLADDPATEGDLAGKTISARAIASFAGKHKTASYFAATSGGNTNKLFDLSGRHLSVTGAGTSATPIDGEFLLSKGHADRGRVFSSAAASNVDGMDHLVTYEVKGTGQPASVYLLCWEDKFAKRSDRDYNDLVVEVQAAELAARAPFTQPLLIPLPPPMWTGLAGLTALAWFMRKGRRFAAQGPRGVLC
jgi:Domain of unknown function (DUF4114)